MWDIEHIIRENNRAAVYAMMEGEKIAVANYPQPKVWPLSYLAERLKIGPPLLSELINGFVDIEVLEHFLWLVRAFLPQYEEEIFAESRSRRVYRFCQLFGSRYFPLGSDANNLSIAELSNALPVELLAMSYDMYHELDLSNEYLLLLSIVIYPYEGDERDEWDDSVPFDPLNLPTEKYSPSDSDMTWFKHLVDSLAVNGQWLAPMGFIIVKLADNRIALREAKDTPEVKEVIRRTLLIADKLGIEAEIPRTGRTSEAKINAARIPLLDAVKQLMGADIAQRIPGVGWTPTELHEMTDGTPYDGVGHFADWACSCTGYCVLDNDYYGCEYLEGLGQPLFKWTESNVEVLTEQWPKVIEYRQKIDHLIEWLGNNPSPNFRELLDFLLSKIPQPAGRENGKPYHSYDTLCPLDQITDEEEYGESADQYRVTADQRL
ncbi:MAG: hypothetical protein KAV87_05195 [Desulfobacteraceae bacterium]|nr:hypothetical protein [Desulfobacteraceae bacterium]